LLTMFSNDVYGQACCNVIGSTEFGVVGRCQEAVIATQVQHTQVNGSFDHNGQYHSLGRSQIQDAIFTIGGGARVLDSRLQVIGSIPFRLQHRDFGQKQHNQSFGIGDVGLALRYTLIKDNMRGWAYGKAPFLDVILSSRLPTGRAPDQGASEALGADVMGEGMLGFGSGLRLTSFFMPEHAIFFSGLYEIRLNTRPSERPNNDTLLGSVGYYYLIGQKWSFSSAIQYIFDDIFKSSLSSNTMTQLRMGLGVNYALSIPIWELSGMIVVDPWWMTVTHNVPFAGVSSMISLKRNFL